jgi:hypothetical protein
LGFLSASLLMCKFERVKYIFQSPSCTSVHFWVKDGITVETVLPTLNYEMGCPP